MVKRANLAWLHLLSARSWKPQPERATWLAQFHIKIALTVAGQRRTGSESVTGFAIEAGLYQALHLSHPGEKVSQAADIRLLGILYTGLEVASIIMGKLAYLG